MAGQSNCRSSREPKASSALDISQLRARTGLITLDPGFGNTGACTSAITFIDGEKGILRYRGIPIEQLAEKSTFIETAWLLIIGRLPKQAELDRFRERLTHHAPLHEASSIISRAFRSTRRRWRCSRR